MQARNLLFFEEDLDTQLGDRQQKASEIVDGIRRDQFLISTDEELIEYVISQLAVEPIVLDEERKTLSQQEAKVEVPYDFTRAFFSDNESGPNYTDGTKIDINIPFTGEAWIFQCRTNSYYSGMFPHAEIHSNFLRITIELPHSVESALFKSNYEKEVNLIRQYIDLANKQVENYNKDLPHLVQQTIEMRRDRLTRHGNIAELLGIPLAPRDGAPSLKPVEVKIRQPRLPVPPRSGLRPEPGITDEIYEQILQCIRHQGRTFERTPSTYAVHGEEGLRDIVLSQLNGHFQGEAMGEAFRCKGKTDICIEQDNRAAFIGECKLWSGSKGLSDALNQLLGYLTWRDSKAALIIFNKENRNFTKICTATMPEALRNHRLFLRNLPCQQDGEGEWRIQMRSAEDEGRRVTVHVFIFDILSST